VILDIYSRYVVGWMLAHSEDAEHAEKLLAETIKRQGIEKGQLSVHADNGSPMVAKTVACLFIDLGVAGSHSRPHTCLLTGQCGGWQDVDASSLWRTAA